jgi:hypothetical protein
MKEQKPINYQALEDLKLMLHEQVKIVDVFVRNKWLCAQLDSGVLFMVKNNL